MTTLRFLGNLSLTTTLILSISGALAGYWLYRRESRQLIGPLAWILPILRSSAIALCILILCQPVIRHRFRLGEPGRLLILLDASQSMAVHDSQYDRDQKLRIAQSLQWLPSNIELPTHNLSDAKSTSTRSVDQFQSTINQFDKTTRYRRAVELLLSGKPGLLEAVKDGFEVRLVRFTQEQQELLWESNVRDSGELPTSLETWMPASFGRWTNLTHAINANLSVAAGRSDSEAASQAVGKPTHVHRSAILLLTDGQHNTAEPPTDLVGRVTAQGDRIFAVGFGAAEEPEDLSIERIESPERLFHQDIVRGTISFKDRYKTNSLASVAIKFRDQIVWERRFTTENSGLRSFEFSFPLEDLIAQQRAQLPNSVQFSAIPLVLDASLSQLDGEADWENNYRKLYITAVTQRVKMLILDGRSRWEIRYLRNIFERDPTWMVDCQIVESASQAASGNRLGKSFFPASSRELFEYDIIILGELPSTTLRPNEQQWLKEFVELTGGGLIVIDGARNNLRDNSYRTLHGLLPIEWPATAMGDHQPARSVVEPFSAKLTAAGSQLGVFQLVGANESNDDAWRKLPQLNFASRSRVLPGAEVLVELDNGLDQIPLFATRQFGAGRVFFSSSDETWRWRFRIADTVHRRLWNQIGRWVMRLPMAVHGEYVSLDSGKSHYLKGERIEIRARLRDLSGKPSRESSIEAVITSHDQRSSAVALVADSQVPGVFRGKVDHLAVGTYDVKIRASGYSEQALNVSSRFEIQAPEAKDMSTLAKNAPLLRKLAESTGGQYLDEERAHELASHLAPLSGGRIVETDFALWSSYWWFVPVMCLLSLEWWLRKRANLV